MSAWTARPIETEEEIRGVIGGPCTLAEILDCLQQARLLDSWDLIEAASGRAIEMLTGALPSQSVADVAAAYVRSRLHVVAEFDQLPGALQRTYSELQTVRVQAAVEQSMSDVDELRQLLAEGSPASMISACAALRRLDRPDFGVEAADRARRSPRIDVNGMAQALTTSGAALVDLGRPELGLERLHEAWKLRESNYTANAASRASLALGDAEGARVWAETALADGDNPFGLRSLLAALRALGDTDDMNTVAGRLSHVNDGQRTDHCWLTYVTGSNAASAGDFPSADAALKLVAAECSIGLAKRLASDIRRAKTVQQRHLPQATR